MSRFLNLMKRTPMLIPFLLILFFYMPSALLLPPEVDRNAIVTAVGIDKEGEEYKMSFLRFVPQANPNYSEKLEVVTCSGKNVSENLEKASVIMGKNLNLNHVESIILGKSVLEEEITKILDFFARAPIVLTGCVLSGTNESAQEVIEAINSLNDESGLKIEEILRFAEQHYYGRETTLESFYSGYYSPTGTAFLSYVEMVEGEKNGLMAEGQEGSSSGLSSSGEGGSSEQQGQTAMEKKKLLSNNGKLLLMKKGHMQTILTREDVRGLNYVKSQTGKATLSVPDYDLGDGKIADVIFEVVENTTTSQVSFENDIPIVKYNVKMKLDLFEIVDKTSHQKQSLNQYDMDERITGEIEKVVKDEFSSSLQILRLTKTDPIELYETLQKADRKNFEKFLSTLENKDDFVSYVVFAISVESNPF